MRSWGNSGWTVSWAGLCSLLMACGSTKSGEGGDAGSPSVGGGSQSLDPKDDVRIPLECPPATELPHGWTAPVVPQPDFLSALDPGNSDTFYAGLFPSAQLFRTHDAGETWCGLQPPEPLTLLAVAIADRSVVYGASSERFYRGSEHGNAWEPMTNVQFLPDSWLVTHPTRVDAVYAVGYRAQRSHDAGQTWEVSPEGYDNPRLGFDGEGIETLYAVTDPCTLNRSENWGKTWKQFTITDTCPQDFAIGMSREIFVSSDGTLYLARYGASQTSFYFSTDRGEHWSASGRLPFLAQAPYPRSFRGDAPGALYATEGPGLQRSTDFGETFTEHLRLEVDGFVNRLGPRPGVFFAMTPNGGTLDRYLRTMDDGASWSPVLVGREGTLHTTPADPDRVYLAGAHRLYRSDDHGETFQALTGSEPLDTATTLVVSPGDADLLLQSGIASARRSDDGGMSWSPWSIEVDGAPESAFLDLQIAPSEPATWYAIGRDSAAVLKSEDGGESFTALAGAPEADALVVAPSDPQIVYAIKGKPGQGSQAALSSTSDGGVTWQTVCQPPGSCPAVLAVHPTNPQVLFGTAWRSMVVVTLPSFQRSIDGGTTWTGVGPGPTPEGTTWGAFFLPDGSVVASSGGASALLSVDEGATWQDLQAPVPLRALAIDYASPSAFFVERGGLWHFSAAP